MATMAKKFIYRLLRIGQNVGPKMSSFSKNGFSIFNVTDKCCENVPGICEDLKNISELQEKIRKRGDKIDKLQLEAQNLQQWTESTRNKFSLLLSEMADIMENSEILLKSVSPRAFPVLDQKIIEIKEQIRINPNDGDFATVISSLEQAVKSTVSPLTTIFDLVFPSITKVTNFACDKCALRKAIQFNDSLTVPLKMPRPESSLFLSIQGWLGKSQAKINADSERIKATINQNYYDAVTILDLVSKRLSILNGYLGTTHDLYKLIKNAEKCEEKKKVVGRSVKDLKKALAFLDNALDDILSSKGLIEKSWNVLRAIISPPLRNDLEQIKVMLNSVSSPKSNIKNLVSSIGRSLNYLRSDAVSSSYRKLYEVLDTLTLDIKQSAFTVNCYNSKVQMINFVTTECSQGNGDIFSLYTQGIAMFDTNAGQCEHNLGLLHVTEDVIKTSMKDIAKMMNFKENCILNSRISKKYACQLKNSGYDIEGIAKKMKLDLKDVQALVQDCPKATITPALKATICNLKKVLKDEQIAATMKLNLEDVKALQC